ncbi:unnamed protein product, partial [Ectocarpus fasciculatus]
MAAVPTGALDLPRSYVERAAVQEVADGLISPEEPRAPYTVVGMGGGGKTIVPLYECLQAARETVLGLEHPDGVDVALALNSRASVGKYTEPEPLYERSLTIRGKVLGPEHPDVATSLNNQAELLYAQGKYGEAGPLYARSQAMREKTLGPDHPAVATVLNNRAALMYAQADSTNSSPLLVCTFLSGGSK